MSGRARLDWSIIVGYTTKTDSNRNVNVWVKACFHHSVAIAIFPYFQSAVIKFRCYKWKFVRKFCSIQAGITFWFKLIGILVSYGFFFVTSNLRTAECQRQWHGANKPLFRVYDNHWMCHYLQHVFQCCIHYRSLTIVCSLLLILNILPSVLALEFLICLITSLMIL